MNDYPGDDDGWETVHILEEEKEQLEKENAELRAQLAAVPVNAICAIDASWDRNGHDDEWRAVEDWLEGMGYYYRRGSGEWIPPEEVQP